MKQAEYADYLKEQIRYWEGLRESAWLYTQTPIRHSESVREHDKFSACAQVLLSALWELNGENKPTMREVLAERLAKEERKG